MPSTSATLTVNSSDQQRDESSVSPHHRIQLPSVAYPYVSLLFILAGALVLKMYKRRSSSAEDVRSDSRVEHSDSGVCNSTGYMAISTTDSRVMEACPENP